MSVTAVSGRDVQQTADPSLHHQRWTANAGAGTGGRQVRDIIIRYVLIQDISILHNMCLYLKLMVTVFPEMSSS